jgi:anti-sigma regulatory factor (Ser/Thr protein kinase)
MGTLRVDPDPASAATVRRAVGESLDASGLPAPVIDDAVLIATELLGNSLRHADALPSGELRVSWDVDGDGVVVRVTDGGGGQLPHVRNTRADATTGRGLRIVDALAAEWGVESQPDGATTVWAWLAVPRS